MQALGMQRLSPQGNGETGIGPGPIDRIVYNGVADLGEMDADLMSPAGLEPAFHEAGDLAERLQHPEMSHRGNPQRRVARDSAPAVATITHQRHVNAARRPQKDPLDDSRIGAVDGVSSKHVLKRP